jgi:hypothetical protein
VTGMPKECSHLRAGQRGSSLLLALMIVAILTIVAFAIVQMGSTEADAVGAKRRYDHAVSCSDAARDLLMSQFKAYNVTPTSLTLNQVIDDQIMASGHYDNLAVTSVVAAAGFGSGMGGASDVSNRIARAGLGGQVYRMTVVCTSSALLDASSRQSEVEFLVRFGL